MKCALLSHKVFQRRKAERRRTEEVVGPLGILIFPQGCSPERGGLLNCSRIQTTEGSFLACSLGLWEESLGSSVRGLLDQPGGWPREKKSRDVDSESEGLTDIPISSSDLPRHERRVESQQGWRGPVEMGSLSHSEGPVMPVGAEVTLSDRESLSWREVRPWTAAAAQLYPLMTPL